MEYREFTGKTVEDAVMEAAISLRLLLINLIMRSLKKEAADFLESEANQQRSKLAS